jgi:hypothetical protein
VSFTVSYESVIEDSGQCMDIPPISSGYLDHIGIFPSLCCVVVSLHLVPHIYIHTVCLYVCLHVSLFVLSSVSLCQYPQLSFFNFEHEIYVSSVCRPFDTNADDLVQRLMLIQNVVLLHRVRFPIDPRLILSMFPYTTLPREHMTKLKVSDYTKHSHLH